MNAQQMLLDYAKTRNNTDLTDQQFIGKAIQEGIVINRSGGDRTFARVKREGKTIILSETTVIETVAGHEENTVEIFRVDL